MNIGIGENITEGDVLKKVSVSNKNLITPHKHILMSSENKLGYGVSDYMQHIIMREPYLPRQAEYD